jgi:recombination associated protein RdgC
MGFIHGSVTCTRFMVAGDLPDDFRERAAERISRYAFRMLREDSDLEVSMGWVNVLDDLQVGFHGHEFFKEPYLALSFRVDTRTVPARSLRQYCREAEDEVKAREDLEFLNKKRRQEIRDAVMGRLLRRAVPRSRVYDMVWDLQSGVVLFGTTGKKVCDAFSEVFYNTFELRLTSVYPYVLARNCLQEGGMDPAVLENLQPAVTALKEDSP